MPPKTQVNVLFDKTLTDANLVLCDIIIQSRSTEVLWKMNSAQQEGEDINEKFREHHVMQISQW